jgi:hypothetical protein
MVNNVKENADFMRCVEGDDWKCESGDDVFSALPLDSQFAVLEDLRKYVEEFRDHLPTSPRYEKNLQAQLGTVSVRPWMLSKEMEYYAASKSSSKSLESIRGHAMKTTRSDYLKWYNMANRSPDENMDKSAVKIRRSVTASVEDMYADVYYVLYNQEVWFCVKAEMMEFKKGKLVFTTLPV